MTDVALQAARNRILAALKLRTFGLRPADLFLWRYNSHRPDEVPANAPEADEYWLIKDIEFDLVAVADCQEGLDEFVEEHCDEHGDCTVHIMN